jgi:hypothetical protein
VCSNWTFHDLSDFSHSSLGKLTIVTGCTSWSPWLLAHQVARTFHLEAITNHGTVGTVSSAKGIVAVDVGQFPEELKLAK